MDWAALKTEFLELVRAKKRHPVYDCVVAFSGGKDSASIAWRLKHELGLNPLLACYGQLCWTDVGRRNFHRVADAGFDIMYWRTNQRVSRYLARRFIIERGHIKQGYDAAVQAVPLHTALSFGIPLVLFAEAGEATYGGNVLSPDHYRIRDRACMLENSIGDAAENWADAHVSEADLFPYILPDPTALDIGGIEAHYYAYYFPWDVAANAELMQAKIGFEGVEPRSDGSPEGRDSIDDAVDGCDFWWMYLKFGFGRATRWCSRMIQLNRMTREQGLRLVRAYDGEFPEMYLPQVLDYVGMTRAEFIELADKHRQPELWEYKWGMWCPKFEVT